MNVRHVCVGILLAASMGAMIAKPTFEGRIGRSVSALLETTFDISSQKLSPGFTGNTVEWIIRNATVQPKDPFETISEFKARREAFRRTTYFLVADRPPDLKYDKKMQTGSVTIYPGVTNITGQIGRNFRGFDIHRTKLRQSTYQRPDMYGNSPQLITLREWKQTQLVTDERDSAFSVQLDPIVLSFPFPVDRVPVVKSTLRVGFVCSPQTEQFAAVRTGPVPEATSVDQSNSTRDVPEERRTYYVAVRASLLEIWIFDQATGEVYARFTPDGSLLSAPSARHDSQ